MKIVTVVHDVLRTEIINHCGVGLALLSLSQALPVEKCPQQVWQLVWQPIFGRVMVGWAVGLVPSTMVHKSCRRKDHCFLVVASDFLQGSTLSKWRKSRCSDPSGGLEKGRLTITNPSEEKIDKSDSSEGRSRMKMQLSHLSKNEKAHWSEGRMKETFIESFGRAYSKCRIALPMTRRQERCSKSIFHRYPQTFVFVLFVSQTIISYLIVPKI